MYVNLRRRIVAIVTFGLLFTVLVMPTYAETLSLDINIVNPTIGPVQTGQLVEYVLDFSCSSTTGDCGDLTIDFTLDSEFNVVPDGVVEVIAPPGYTGEHNSGVVTITSDNVFNDGDAAQVTVRARVGQDLDDLQLDGDLVGEITNGPGAGDDVTLTVNGPPLGIDRPQGNWSVDKEQTVPSGVVDAAPDGDADFAINICPEDTGGEFLGVGQLTPPITVVDTIPPGADPSPVPSLPAGFTGTVNYDAGAGTITWEITGLTNDPHTVENGCITLNYRLNFPAPPFTVGTAYSNDVTVTSEVPPTNDPFNDCPTTNCVGTGGTGGDIDPPTVNGNGSKNGPGTTAIVGPGDSDGTSVFELGWNLNEANVPIDGFTVTDDLLAGLPTDMQANDSQPIIEITEINSGRWDGGYQAVIEIQTVGGAGWTALDTVDGSGNVTYTSGVTPGFPVVPTAPDTTGLVTALRWRFIDQVPPGFSSSNSTPPSYRFFVRDTGDPDDYDDGTNGYNDYENCLTFGGTFDGGTAVNSNAACDTLRVGDDPTNGFTNIQTRKTVNPSAAFPLQDITFTLELDLTQEASGDLVNPMIEDLLPFGMQIVRWDDVEFVGLDAGEQIQPYLIVDDVGGQQRLRFYWNDTLLAGTSYTCAAFPCTMDTNIDPSNPVDSLEGVTAGTAGSPNPVAITPPESGNKTITITFTGQARLDTPAADATNNTVIYGNTSATVTDSTNLVCQTGTESDETTLGRNVDEDADGNETICTISDTYEILEAAAMVSQKWIRDDSIASDDFLDSNNLDNASPSCPQTAFDTTGDGTDELFTRFPCVAQGFVGSDFEYLLRMRNSGLVDVNEYIMYDILPHEVDFGVSEATSGDPRESEFTTFLSGPIDIESLPGALTAADITIEYYTDAGNPYNPCRPEMSDDSDETGWQGACGNTWTTTFPAGTPKTVTAFRIILNSGVIPSGGEMIFSVPMFINDVDGDAETGEIAWNNFAQRFTNQPSGRRLLTAEPRKVGIIVEERYSVGNRVWIDNGAGDPAFANDGEINNGEAGIDGILMELLYDSNGDGTIDGADTPLTDTTRNGGYYFFGNLPGGTDNDYIVRVATSNFDPGADGIPGTLDAGEGLLSEYISSSGNQNASNNNNTDSNDTGVDPADPADYDTDGVESNTFQLTRDSEAVNETDVITGGSDGSPPSNEGPFGRGENAEADNDSDLTVDFGFFKPMAIGNRVWFDSNTNGLIDGTDENPATPGNPGIENVVVELYASGDTPGTDTPLATTTTDANGYYLFDLLPPGDYVVWIAAENFQFDVGNPTNDGALARLISTIPDDTADNDEDNDDNGIDPTVDGTQITLGILSPVIQLREDGETETEDPADKGPGVDGRRATDDNSSLTVDFGFYEETTIFSLGNRVWIDDGGTTGIGNDGILNGDEVGIQGVQLALYSDNADANGIPDDLALQTTTTDANGNYLFDNLDPGRYIVQMLPSNWNDVNGNGQFDAGDGVLVEYISSSGNGDDNEEDSEDDENGIDPTDGNTDNTVVDEYIANGVFSTTILLEPENEPTGEADTGDPGSGSAEDDNSDLTIDFGVYRPLSIGNLVWLDDGAGGGTRADGIVNGSEAGIGGVTVNLLDGSGTLITSTTTSTAPDNVGYYLFDGLPPGDYIVEIPYTGNFEAGQILEYHESSLPEDPADANGALYGNPAEDDDSTDHGEFPNDTQVTADPGVQSDTITLTYDSEPTDDTDLSNNAADGPQFRGNNGETDDNSDLTVDFGFYVPPLSIGNRIWFDTNNNSQLDGTDENPATPGDPAIAGVPVNLLLDADGNGTIDPGEETPILSTTTDADGYYLFGDLPPGDYVVQIPGTAFDGGTLDGLISSDDTLATDNDNDDEDSNLDENGIDPTDDNTSGSVIDEYIADGIRSAIIALRPRTEPEGGAEVDRSTDTGTYGTNNNGVNGEDDDGSNLTVDFSFYRPMSLGNRVWLDNGTVGAGVNTAFFDDGILNGDEVGIGGVTVNLYFSSQTPGTDTPIATTTTNGTGFGAANGYYRFDGLVQGDYIVEIPAAEFTQELTGLVSSFDSDAPADNDPDLNDHGDDPAVAGNAVLSPVIALRYDSEPDGTDDAEDGPGDPGVNGEEDDNSDLTVDFGFVSPPMSIGNRVWIDDGGGDPLLGNNGIFDGAESALDNVTVNLYRDANSNNIADSGELVGTTVTANNGHYLFDNLPSGDYIVEIPAAEFDDPDGTPGNGDEGDLFRLISSINTPADGDADNNDHGIDATVVGGAVFSPVITLTGNGETQPDDESGPDDPGTNGETDNNSDLTVDFGFFRPMSLGNRVWFDDNNNGIIDPTESGIDGVLVELYTSTQTPGTDTPLRTAVTDNGGYYLFDGILPGDYVVRLAPSNFDSTLPDDGNPDNGQEGVLTDAAGAPYSSSEDIDPTFQDDTGVDRNDNGVDENFPNVDGISSNVITLSYDDEPSAANGNDDTDLDATTGESNLGVPDDSAEMTVDFGVYTPRMSLGNRVFFDYDNNRQYDGVDVGVNGVVVNLFEDSNSDGIPDSGINNPLATTTTVADGTTGEDGYYIFDNLDPGFYLVQIDEVNFRSVSNGGNGILLDFYSSQDKDAANNPVTLTDDENDTFENGVDDPFNPGNNPSPIAEGVFSVTVELVPSGEIDSEADLQTGVGNGEPNIQASNSDLTIDFGFYQPLSIGNVVWFDTDEDGVKDAGESGIAGVQVELYADNGDGTFDTATDTLVPVYDAATASYLNFDTTDSNGYYLFDNLIPGNYFVHIPAANFGGTEPLVGHISTLTGTDPNSDTDDNGTPDDTTANTDGVTSGLIALGAGGIPDNGEPTGETDKSNNPPGNDYDGPESIGRYGELDNNSNITVDFGFILETGETLSIGNRVWFDEDRSGLIESTNAFGNDENTGIDGVTVLLYQATTGGAPTGDPIARDITANGGYYLFDVLDTDAADGAANDGDGAGGPVTPGNYVVVIPNSNFTGGVLEGFTSTTTAVDNPGTAAPSTIVEGGYGAAADDNNDNGDENPSFGVISDLVTLTFQGERDDETDLEAGVDNGTDSTGNPITANNSDLTIDFGFYQPLSLGNRVWVDANNDGLFDAGESPVPDGVTLTLYNNDGGIPDSFDGTNTPVDNPNNPGNPYQVTTDNGYYLFENLPPGEYIVVLDAANFAPGTGDLEGFTGSDNNGAGFEDDTTDDLNDNGRDVTDPTTNGIPSGLIDLTTNNQPTGEETSDNPADGPQGRGNNGETDANSNLTVDFGVYPSTYYSIGNRIWEDLDGNGTHDDGEPGIENVIINLYRDDDQDGTPDSLTAVDTVTTDADGYYLFDGLPTGDYIVSVAPQNFDTGGALEGYGVTAQPNGTEGNPNNDTDHTSDHAVTTVDPDYGIYTGRYELTGTGEPTGEADATGAGATQEPGVDPFGNPIPDNQSNLTVDLGFVRSLSIGNLIWFDVNNNGIYDDTTETGIAGVTVELYQDDGNALFDPTLDTLIGTDITDGNGYYLFDTVPAGNYFIHIPEDPNFLASGPLDGMQSSTDDATSANDTQDLNDNGVGTGVPGTDPAPTPGVTSELLTLAFGNAPTGESDLSQNDDDGPEFRGTSNPLDENSDLTRDFGFFSVPLSLGNRVWIDDGGTTGTASDGILNGDEAGIGGVTVELYADNNNDGNPDTATPLDTTTTDDDGYYLFDGLPQGRYVVVLSEDNWTSGLLDGYLSTTDGTPDNDSQDNGINNANPGNGGIRSGSILLEAGTEPTSDDDLGPDGDGTNGELDDNSNLTVDFGLVVAYDWGDAPDSYGTDADTTDNGGDSAQSGASHRIIANLYIGDIVDDEGDGNPVTSGDPADGDDTDSNDDEDGLDPPPFVSGTTVDVDVTVFNDTGDDATLIGWFDWNGDGTFDPDEAYQVTVPDGTDGVVQLSVSIPDDAQDLTGGETYVRLRLTTDPIDASEPTGQKDSGEVEDYQIEVRDPGLLINKTDGKNSIVAGTFNTYTITIENSGVDRTAVRFTDDFPLATDTDATGYDPETIEWQCEAFDGASCVATEPAGTGASDGPFDENATSVVIDEEIDIPNGGRIVYTITGRINENAGLVPPGGSGPVRNTAALPNEPLEEFDETDIIFDPPFGIKTGRVNSQNIIEWTMVWYNPGATQTGVIITDTVQPPQQLGTPAQANLRCSGGLAGGADGGTCSRSGNTITWTGTMDTSTPDNDTATVRITFNVRVPGPGTYQNVGSLSSTSLSAADINEARGRVTINDDGSQEDDGSDGSGDDESNVDETEPVPVLQDPAFVKLGDPVFARPGEDVDWTIILTNPNDQDLFDLELTDNMPEDFQIRAVNADAGTVSVEGQTIRIQLDRLEARQRVQIVISTRLSPDIEEAEPIRNVATLNNGQVTEATVIVVMELPDTGETPWQRYLLLLILAGGVLTGASIWRYRRTTS